MRNILLASATAATLLTSVGVSAPAFAQAGSFQGSCRNVNSSNGMLTAECADGQGRFHFNSLPYTQCRGDIGNNNGTLVCNGATASGGQIVGGNNNGGDNRGRGRGGNETGAAVAGLAVGALLGGALLGNNGQVAPPPPPPPAYGDARYGDPRYDWRYQQGGYGYGRRAGEFVPIRDRAPWLDRQIDNLLRERRIDRSDARDYRNQLDRLINRERDMMRDGRLGPRDRDELDRRFNDLTDEIRRDARER